MATHINQIDSDIAHILNVKKHLQHTKYKDVTAEDIRAGGLARSTLVEIAVSACGGFAHTPENGRDHGDGSDTKSITTRKRDNLSTYSANVSDTNNKTGLLRVQLYEKYSNKFYYFAIPYWAHSQAKNDLEISFTKTGDPCRIPKTAKKIPNWWDFECDTFEEMCKVPNDGMRPRPVVDIFATMFVS